MSKYTTELRYICEELAGLDKSVGYSKVESVIASATPLIFDFTYPLYEGVDKQRLESSIVLAYYTREIGFETYGLWKLKLMAKMRRIMPYYNQLYESADLKYNPLENVNYTETGSGTNAGTRETGVETTDNTVRTSEGNSSESRSDKKTGNDDDIWSGTIGEKVESTRKYSDTPSGALVGLKADEYLTEAEMNEQSSTTTRGDKVSHIFNNTVNGSGSREYSDSGSDKRVSNSDTSMQERFVNNSEKTIVGKVSGASYATMIKEYREMILNIDAMIIADLEDLFMGVW